MAYRPFGKEENGEKIQDVSGISVRAMVTFLEEYITQRDGAQAGKEAVQKACELLNGRISEPAYHVTPKFLLNVWNSYSYEFTIYLREFCEQITADPAFHLRVGQEGYLHPSFLILLRPFTLPQLARMAPRMCAKFTPQLHIVVESVSSHSAVLRLKFTDRVLAQFGPYRQRCRWMIFQGIKGSWCNIPVKLFGLPPGQFDERTCLKDGEEWHEVRVSWSARPTGQWIAPMTAVVGGLTLFAYLWQSHPNVALVPSLLMALLPIAIWYLSHRQIRNLYRLISDQESAVNERHEELRDVYVEQQQTSVELRRKVTELTELRDELQSLNLGLESRVKARTVELQAANAKLIEMNQVKSRFIAHVSHELRTPLTSMVGFAENMLDGILGLLNEEQEHALKRISANAAHLGRMIDNLLNQASIEAGKIRLSMLEVSLSAVISNAVDQLRPLLERKGHRIAIIVDEALTVWVDRDKVSQIVTNLVSNAIKYTQEGGSITIHLARKDKFAQVFISDTGEGIPAGVIPHLFDPFFRVNHSERSSVKGLGLGLSIVKQLVELHGGTIEVRSELHHGTEFTFTMPLVRIPISSTVCFPCRGHRILVVDDDADIRQMLSDRLRANRFEVLQAHEGKEALDVLARNSLHGMILDIGIPGLDGLEVLTLVRENYPTMPIIMITAAASEERAVAGILAGAQAYLLKPLNGMQFQQTIDRWFVRIQAEGFARH